MIDYEERIRLLEKYKYFLLSQVEIKFADQLSTEEIKTEMFCPHPNCDLSIWVGMTGHISIFTNLFVFEHVYFFCENKHGIINTLSKNSVIKIIPPKVATSFIRITN